MFVYDEDLVKTLNSYNKVAMKKIDKKIDYKKYNERLFFKEIEVRKIFKSVKEINEIEVEEIDFATKSINFSIDLLTYVIKEGNPTDKAISMFIEKVIVLKDKICTEQLHDEHARDLMGVISVSNIIGFTSKEVEELKKILETKSYSQIIENQEIIEKYYNEKTLMKIEKKSKIKKELFIDLMIEYTLIKKLFTLNDLSIKQMSKEERSNFIEELYDNLTFFIRRVFRTPYSPFEN